VPRIFTRVWDTKVCTRNARTGNITSSKIRYRSD